MRTGKRRRALSARHRRGSSRLRKTLTAFGLLELFVIEAIARRNLVRFLIILGVVFAVISTVGGVTVFFGWQVTVAVYFGALALLITNQPELVRDWRRRIRDGARPKSGQP